MLTQSSSGYFALIFHCLVTLFICVAYIRPFVNEIESVSKFVLKSQWKYQVPFEFAKKQVNLINVQSSKSSSFGRFMMNV